MAGCSSVEQQSAMSAQNRAAATLLAGAVASCSGAARGNSVERDSQEWRRTRTQEGSQERGEVRLETMTEVNVSSSSRSEPGKEIPTRKCEAMHSESGHSEY